MRWVQAAAWSGVSKVSVGSAVAAPA